jgi:hypothetical protein
MIMKSNMILDVLKRNHPPAEGWIFLAELRTATGFSPASELDTHRYIDAFAIHTGRTENLMRVAYEIKVGRSDWLSELKDCRKRTQAYFLSNRFYYAVAEGIVDLRKDPLDCLDGCGVLEVREDESILLLRAALTREAWPMPNSFVASVLRKAFRAQPENRERPDLLVW